MAKLTLSVDSKVVDQAKVYAKSRGVSVSHMVETYLVAVTNKSPEDDATDTPILSMMTGLIKQGDVADYKKYLFRKYR